MNLAYNMNQENTCDLEIDEERTSDRSRESKTSERKVRRNNYAQKSRPSVHSGIHRRRNKRFGT